MRIVFNLGGLPELQRLDPRRRREAILDWHIALWKGWSGYLFEVGIFVGVIAAFRILWHFVAGDNIHRPWYVDLVWILPASLVALALRNHLIYLRRRDVLAKILERPEYAASNRCSP